MKSYLGPFIASFGILFIAIWVSLLTNYGALVTWEYQVNRAHEDLMARCDLGNLDIVGDSTASADYLATQIGPGTREFGLGGATPVESYYLVKSLLHCRNRPKAVILSFVPSAFGDDPSFPSSQKTFFWTHAVAFGVVNFKDEMQILRSSKNFGDTLITGVPSIFDLDYKIKAFLYPLKFPPYFLPSLQGYVISIVRNGGKQARQSNMELSLVYNQTIWDHGHHFYGLTPYDGDVYDYDAFRTDDRISPMTDFYFRQTIKLLLKNGIVVLLVEPPANRTSATHYPSNLTGIYQKYLLDLQASDPRIHLLGNGFPIWDTHLFGDPDHLDLRGALAFSSDIHKMLIGVGRSELTYSDADLKPHNLYAANDMTETFWKIAAGNVKDKVTPTEDIALPELAYTVNSTAWLYRVQSPHGGSGLRGPSIQLNANTNYAISILIKNFNADEASLEIAWPGGTNGKVGWNFRRRQISNSGMANYFNSSVTICPGGWIELFLSGKTGPNPGSSAGPILTLSAPNPASAYIYDVTVEGGLWPTNFCRLQLGETEVVPLP